MYLGLALFVKRCIIPVYSVSIKQEQPYIDFRFQSPVVAIDIANSGMLQLCYEYDALARATVTQAPSISGVDATAPALQEMDLDSVVTFED